MQYFNICFGRSKQPPYWDGSLSTLSKQWRWQGERRPHASEYTMENWSHVLQTSREFVNTTGYRLRLRRFWDVRQTWRKEWWRHPQHADKVCMSVVPKHKDERGRHRPNAYASKTELGAWCFGCWSAHQFFCSAIQFYLLFSPYLCFISLLYLDLYVLGDDALMS